MIIPKYWVEVHRRERRGRRSVAVRRWGWSKDSEAEARAMAEQRAREALAAHLAGDPAPYRERKLAYGSPDGMPIREEVLAEHDSCVVTRNSYGAECLNVPDVLIADVDFPQPRRRKLGCGPVLLALVALLLVTAEVRAWRVVLIAAGLWGALRLFAKLKPQPDPRPQARAALERFLAEHPRWRVRLYLTPAGLRLIADHARFEATSPEVQAFFEAMQVDPKYARLCTIQQCFRARLTPKPWRVGFRERLRPRPGVWPLDSDEKRALRAAWITRYERACRGYAACHYEETLGHGTRDAYASGVVALHDRLSQAKTELPIA